MNFRKCCSRTTLTLSRNAARHAPESSPIRIAAARDGVHVALSVSDERRGIPPERVAHLFRKYSGAGGVGPGDGTGGAGLGLAICKGLVEAHGGRIRAESAGRTVELAATEYERLRALSLNAGRVTTHEALLREVWAKRTNADPNVCYSGFGITGTIPGSVLFRD